MHECCLALVFTQKWEEEKYASCFNYVEQFAERNWINLVLLTEFRVTVCIAV